MTCTERKRMNSQHQAVGRWIRPEKRLAIYLRDRFTCCHCHRDLTGVAPADISLDHLDCQSHGEKSNNHESNLATSCRSCNSSRRDQTLEGFAGKAKAAAIRKAAGIELKPFITMAKALMNGETGSDNS